MQYEGRMKNLGRVTRTVLDEHLLFLRRLCRKGNDLIHKAKNTVLLSQDGVFLALYVF